MIVTGGRKWLIATFAGASVSVLALACARQTPSSGTELSLASLSIDLGSVESGELKSGSVAVRNTGNYPVQILEVGKSCSCTAAEMSKTRLAPNEEAVLKLTLTGNKSAKQMSALVRCRWKVEGAKQDHTAEVRVSAAVNALAHLNRPHISLMRQSSTEGAEATIALQRANSPIEWNRLEIRSSNPSIGAEAIQLNPNNYQIVVRCREDDAPIGNSKGEVKVLFYQDDVKCNQELSLPWTLQTGGNVRCSPPTVFLGTKSAADKVSATALIKGKPFVVSEVIASSPQIKCTIAATEPECVRLQIDIEPGSTKGQFNGHIDVMVAGIKSEKLRIPVIGYFK